MDPDYDEGGYPDHLYVYTGDKRVSIRRKAASAVASRPGGGGFRNGDPLLANFFGAIGGGTRGENYHAFSPRVV
ncbi:MAG: hypothetical protein Ct9H300mP8_08760 [Gammaproteobacteria bacterium]|nr:MAG: hypothetical protein Ct9H300mP8_08760 [Gammaproteobacteria bacterium]